MLPSFAAALALAFGVPAVAAHPTHVADPCYVAFTAVVIDSATGTIQRVITSGVRRLEATPGAASTNCNPTDADRPRAAERAVRDHLARTGESRTVEFIEIRNRTPEIVADHLTRIAAAAGHDPTGDAHHERTNGLVGFVGFEVVHLNYGTGRDSAFVPLPGIALGDSARARCAARASAIGRDSLVYRWTC